MKTTKHTIYKDKKLTIKNSTQTISDEIDIGYIIELEQKWKQSFPKYSEKELLEIYPAIIDEIPYKLSELFEKRKSLISEIKGELREIRKIDKSSRWFNELILVHTKGKDLFELEQEIARFKKLQLIATGKIIQNIEDRKWQALGTPIVEIVNQFVKLRKSGRNFVGLCPFHKEKNPSFYVYPDTNSCWCFGCNKGGNVINFVRLVCGYSFKEAINYLLGGK